MVPSPIPDSSVASDAQQQQQQQQQQSTTLTTATKPPIKIVFCVPGNTFSREFMISWSSLLSDCIGRGITPILSQQYSSVVHFARAKCLGADVKSGPDQKPFQGSLTYDYIMWIDSDIIFNASDLAKLVESPHDVTSGLYKMADNQHFAAVKTWDTEYFKEHGTFEFFDQAKLDAEPDRYVPVSYAGMGWMLVRSGVIETLKYPWFNTELQVIPKKDGTGVLVDMCSEDVAFCRNLAEAGVRVHLDKTCRVGHQKAFVI